MNREQPGLNIDFSQTTAEVCEECGNDTFVSAIKLRKLSALLSFSEKFILDIIIVYNF